MAGKVDRRVRKTKAQLREGLARLMLQKSIKEITVKELVDEVDINRSTFYLHYTAADRGRCSGRNHSGNAKLHDRFQ